MKKIFMAAGVLAWVLLGIIPLTTYAGGVFVTGHDPDYHAFAGVDVTGAKHIIQRAVAYVTFDKLNPMLLLVTDLRNPGGDEIDSRLGMTAAGFTYDVADYGSGTPGVLDLNTVDFNNYDAIVVASDYGGWLRQDELDILNARSAELIDYVNTGNRGMVAFNESGNRAGGPGIYTGTTHNRYSFLPFLVSEVPLHQIEVGFTVTAAGVAMGLTDADVNGGNATHSLFVETGGMDVIDIDAEGRIMSLATRKTISTGGVNNPPDCSGAYPSLLEIWPPNHKMVGVNILGVTDADGDPVTITITGITQDEPLNGLGDGDTCPDGAGVGTSTAQIRAERDGHGNGRVYEISFTASDGTDECTGSVNVCVPHDVGLGHVCIDDGQIYDSTVCP